MAKTQGAVGNNKPRYPLNQAGKGGTQNRAGKTPTGSRSMGGSTKRAMGNTPMSGSKSTTPAGLKRQKNT
jgi:hypothetical protein